MDDLISRQDAIDAIIRYLMSPQAQLASTRSFKQCAIDILWDVPSAERKRGKWIDGDVETGALNIQYTEKICSICGWSHSLVIPNNFCPNCGADMRGEKNDHR